MQFLVSYTLPFQLKKSIKGAQETTCTLSLLKFTNFKVEERDAKQMITQGILGQTKLVPRLFNGFL